MESLTEKAYVRNLQLLSNLAGNEKNAENKWQKESGTVLITSNLKSLESSNGQYAFCMSLNLLCRLYPIITKIGIVIPDSVQFSADIPLFPKGRIKQSVTDFIGRFQPDCTVELLKKVTEDWDASLSIGPSELQKDVVSISSDGWIAYVSPTNSVINFSENANPIGAYASACIGGMEIFKRILLKKSNALIPKKSNYDIRWRLSFIQDSLSFSTLNYKVNCKAQNPGLTKQLKLNNVHIVGVGAGGGAAAYTLASLPQLDGEMRLVDPDQVKPSNLNRCVFATRQDCEKSKVNVLKTLLSKFPTLNVNTEQVSFQQLAEKGKTANIDMLVSTVDTKETRRYLHNALRGI